jgi:hypothetical protein
MAVAERIESEPGCLEVPLVNIERWLKRGRLNPVPLIEWRRRLVEAGASKDAMASLLEFSLTENEESEPLKSCSPFPGLLSAAEVPQLREVNGRRGVGHRRIAARGRRQAVRRSTGSRLMTIRNNQE